MSEANDEHRRDDVPADKRPSRLSHLEAIAANILHSASAVERHYRTLQASKEMPMAKYIIALLVSALVGAGCNGTSAAPDGGGASIGADSPSGVVMARSTTTARPATAISRSRRSAPAWSSIPPRCRRTRRVATSHSTAGAGAAADDSDGGVATSDYGATMYGAAGNDDDCKYYVSWTATPIQENGDTYFTVSALRLADMMPATCAGVRPDVSLSISHGAPAPKNPSTEIAPGVYKVGPIKFDAPGIWTVRFHFFEECSDTPDDSPHGHAAFYVKVP